MRIDALPAELKIPKDAYRLVMLLLLAWCQDVADAAGAVRLMTNLRRVHILD